MLDVLVLAAAGFVAGTMNALAGGGSFVSFPALVWLGLPSVVANASSTVALFPASLAAGWELRRDLTGVGGLSIATLAPLSMLGGLTGALLLLWTPTRVFDSLVPWLLLAASLTFAAGPRLGEALRRLVHVGPRGILACQFLLSVYGGYFGGAVGLMLMAAWSLLDSGDLKKLNPAKVVLVGVMNSVAIVCFLFADVVWWRQTLVMLVAAACGGYTGAHIGRRMSAAQTRRVVIVMSLCVTAGFFWRAMRGGM